MILISAAALILGTSLICAAQKSDTTHQTATPPVIDEKTLAQSSTDTPEATDPKFSERYPRYALRPGDVLEVSFEFSPEFNQTLTVQPDGFVNLKDVGDVHVSGETVPQLRATITSSYGKILNAPVVSVVLKTFEQPYFTVGGEVGRPGKYDLRGDTTLTEALAIAGGVRDSGKRSQILLFRRVNENWCETRQLDFKKMMAQGNLEEDIHLKPGDMIYVPHSWVSDLKRYIPNPGVGMTVAQPF
jgi:polysaccharide export outer membrane protein